MGWFSMSLTKFDRKSSCHAKKMLNLTRTLSYKTLQVQFTVQKKMFAELVSKAIKVLRCIPNPNIYSENTFI